jgi:hypothetical protein
MAQAEGVTPSQEELLVELQALKLANPEMGAKKMQAAVKEKHPTWLVSEARVKKVAVEAGLLAPAPDKPAADAAAGGGAAAAAPAAKKSSKPKAQTKPEPTVPIAEVYPSGDWPVGEIMECRPDHFFTQSRSLFSYRACLGTMGRTDTEGRIWRRKPLSAQWASRIS